MSKKSKESKSRKPRVDQAQEFANVYNETIKHPTIEAVADVLGVAKKTVHNLAAIYRQAHERDKLFPFIVSRKGSESLGGDQDELLDTLLAIHAEHGRITESLFHKNSEYTASDWNHIWGTFTEFAAAAGTRLTRTQRRVRGQIAKHASLDCYRGLNEQRQGLDEVYLKPTGGRYQTMLVFSDVHDIEVDRFAQHVLLDTAKRVQPDIIVINGDLFDLPEFGKYTVDPRAWDVTGRIKFCHDEILRPLRESCPDAQIDFISGNHEDRLLNHMADATPALKAVLSDLHGFTLSKLFGLDEFEINYIGKSDLRAHGKGDQKRELEKNYKVYFNQFMTNHFPQGRHYGLPGVSGHHHKLVVWSEHNHTFGSYSWYQLGCLHNQTATYCAGERWDLGFAIVTMDTERKSSVIDYVPIGQDLAIAAGKFYYRPEDQAIPRIVTMGEAA